MHMDDPDNGKNPLRAFLTVANVAVPALCGLAAVPLIWLAALGSRAGGGAAAALAILLTVLALGLVVVVWFALSLTMQKVADAADELRLLRRASHQSGERQAELMVNLSARLDELGRWSAMSDATRNLLVGKMDVEAFCRQIEAAMRRK